MRIIAAGPVGGVGGLQTHFRMLLGFLADEGHDVFAVRVKSAFGGGEPLPEIQSAIDLAGAHALSGRIRLLLQIPFLRARIRKFEPDMVIACAIGRSYQLIATASPPNTLRFYHEVIGDIPANHHIRTLMAKSFGRTACQTDRLVNSVRRSVRPIPRIGILPCFADPVGEQFSSRAEAPLPRQRARLVYVGRLAPNKGLQQMVKAFCGSKAYSAATLDIFGTGPEEPAIAKLKAELDPESRIMLRGAIGTNADLARVLAGAHGLVLCSQYGEGLPLILLEAMSVGLPFLATEICGIPDAAEDNPDCILTRPDLDSLKVGLEQFVARLSSNAFSPGRLLKFYERRYHSVVAKQTWREFLSAPESRFRSFSAL